MVDSKADWMVGCLAEMLGSKTVYELGCPTVGHSAMSLAGYSAARWACRLADLLAQWSVKPTDDHSAGE